MWLLYGAAPFAVSIRRKKPDHQPRVFGNQIKISVRCKSDRAYSTDMIQKLLISCRPTPVNNCAVQHSLNQRPCEEITSPSGVSVSGDKIQTGRSDRGCPVVLRRCCPLQQRILRDDRAIVLQAVGRQRPAKIGSCLDSVQLIAAKLSMLGGPDLTSRRVKRHPLVLSVSIAVDFREHTGTVTEGIVRRDAAIIIQPHDFSRLMAQILGIVSITTNTDCVVEIPISVKNNPAAGPRATGTKRSGRVEDLPVNKLILIQPSPHQYRIRPTT